LAAAIGRAGNYLALSGGVRAFVPKALPPDPPIRYSDEYVAALNEAERNLGRLDAIAATLPGAEQFVRMYVRKEAVLSSQIEGTQSTLVDLLQFEAGAPPGTTEEDVGEVANYVSALNLGLDRLEHGSQLDLDLILDVHRELLAGVRGGGRRPGSFRNEQVWIGFNRCRIEEAEFVPPPPGEVARLMGDLETFANAESKLPLLTRAGILHFQFETIHPFFDGNGRVGRMLITLYLTRQGALQRPLLYLSHYFRQRREEYCARLQEVRDDGDWESWLTFFLDGVGEVSKQAAATAYKIAALRESNRKEILDLMGGRAGRGLSLLESLYGHPIVSVDDVRRLTHVSFPTANSLVSALESLGILREETGQKHYRRYSYRPYIEILNERESTTEQMPPPTSASSGTARSQE
jgi:Fic family protein